MKKLLLSFALLFCISHAQASFISAQATLVNDDQLVINYEVTANEFDLEGFSIFFDAFTFDNIMVSAIPNGTDWEGEAFQSIIDPFADDGFVDFFNPNVPLLVGQTLSGFQVTVDIIDGSTPASITQSVEFYNFVDFTFADPFTFTVDRAPVNPEQASSPAIFALFCFSVLVLLRLKSR